jgi:hypothetical protein
MPNALSPEMDDWRELVDMGREIVDDFGLRTNQVFVVTRVWPSGITGDESAGAPVDTTVEITPRPEVVQRSESEFTINGITPPFDGSGWTLAQLSPSITPVTGQPVGTIHFLRLVMETGETRDVRVRAILQPDAFDYVFIGTDLR